LFLRWPCRQCLRYTTAVLQRALDDVDDVGVGRLVEIANAQMALLGTEQVHAPEPPQLLADNLPRDQSANVSGAASAPRMDRAQRQGTKELGREGR
jgi:hypothetical protein